MKGSPSGTLENVPDEIKLLILGFLDIPARLNMALTSKLMFELCQDVSLVNVKTLANVRYGLLRELYQYVNKKTWFSFFGGMSAEVIALKKDIHLISVGGRLPRPGMGSNKELIISNIEWTTAENGNFSSLTIHLRLLLRIQTELILRENESKSTYKETLGKMIIIVLKHMSNKDLTELHQQVNIHLRRYSNTSHYDSDRDLHILFSAIRLSIRAIRSNKNESRQALGYCRQ